MNFNGLAIVHTEAPPVSDRTPQLKALLADIPEGRPTQMRGVYAYDAVSFYVDFVAWRRGSVTLFLKACEAPRLALRRYAETAPLLAPMEHCEVRGATSLRDVGGFHLSVHCGDPKTTLAGVAVDSQDRILLRSLVEHALGGLERYGEAGVAAALESIEEELRRRGLRSWHAGWAGWSASEPLGPIA